MAVINIHYNGGSPGEVALDRLQNITGSMALTSSGEHGFWSSVVSKSAIYPYAASIPSDKYGWAMGSWAYASYNGISFDASKNARTGKETAPASLSAFVGIKY
jgi:hypothetical protein